MLFHFFVSTPPLSPNPTTRCDGMHLLCFFLRQRISSRALPCYWTSVTIDLRSFFVAVVPEVVVYLFFLFIACCWSKKEGRKEGRGRPFCHHVPPLIMSSSSYSPLSILFAVTMCNYYFLKYSSIQEEDGVSAHSRKQQEGWKRKKVIRS